MSYVVSKQSHKITINYVDEKGEKVAETSEKHWYLRGDS